MYAIDIEEAVTIKDIEEDAFMVQVSNLQIVMNENKREVQKCNPILYLHSVFVCGLVCQQSHPL